MIRGVPSIGPRPGSRLSTDRAAAARPGKRLLVLLAALYAIFVAAFALHVAERSLEERFTNFYIDDWSSLFQRSRHPFFRWLFLPHNGHLIPATRLLLHWDYEHLSGRGDLPFAVSFLCTGVTTALLYAFLRAFLADDPPLRRILAAFFAFCLLWSGLYYGFLWGFSVHAPMTLMWITASLACFAAFASQKMSARAPANRGLAVLAGVGALAAGLSSAAGVGVWVSLLAIALVARLSFRMTVAILAGGCVSGALLAFAPSPIGTSLSVVGASLDHPGKLLALLLSFVGIPIAWTIEGLYDLGEPLRYRVSLWAGGVGLLGLLAYAARVLRPARTPDALGLLGLGLMVYGVAVGGLVGLGRAIMGTGAVVHFRFTPFSMLFWLGAASALVSVVSATPRARVRVALAVLLPAASIAMLPALDTKIEANRTVNASISRLSLMVLVGIRSEKVLRALSFDAEVTRSILPMLERDGRGPFADPRRYLLGRRLPGAYAGVGTTRCPGRIRTWEEVETGDAPGAVINGVASRPEGAAAPSSILVVDSNGTIRGLGNVRPTSGHWETKWVAFLGPHAPERRFGVYAELEDGSVCRIAGGRTRGSGKSG